MTMTLKVYQVDRHGRTQVIRPKAEVTPAEEPPATDEFPTCQCHQCKGGQR
ncbi:MULTISPECIES: hypothetical protein [unclassified Streptomyces]|uniref:hypothetical protein n=1 Tax=unclassified Streptomyces TaxID=2593676 RepID=UPI0018FF00A3|nr:hypothetical protein [Streptomyces sp. CB01580]